MPLRWLCGSLHQGVSRGQQVQFIWKIIFISAALSCWSGVFLLLPCTKNKTLSGKPLSRDSSCSLWPASSCWDRAAWMPGGRILAGKAEAYHGEPPSPATAGHKDLGLQQRSAPAPRCCIKGCHARHLPRALHPPPSGSSTSFFLSFPWSTGLHKTCFPPAAFAPGSGFLKMRGGLSVSLAPSGSPRLFGKKCALQHYILVSVEFLASCNLFCPSFHQQREYCKSVNKL